MPKPLMAVPAAVAARLGRPNFSSSGTYSGGSAGLGAWLPLLQASCGQPAYWISSDGPAGRPPALPSDGRELHRQSQEGLGRPVIGPQSQDQAPVRLDQTSGAGSPSQTPPTAHQAIGVEPSRGRPPQVGLEVEMLVRTMVCIQRDDPVGAGSSHKGYEGGDAKWPGCGVWVVLRGRMPSPIAKNTFLAITSE